MRESAVVGTEPAQLPPRRGWRLVPVRWRWAGRRLTMRIARVALFAAVAAAAEAWALLAVARALADLAAERPVSFDLGPVTGAGWVLALEVCSLLLGLVAVRLRSGLVAGWEDATRFGLVRRWASMTWSEQRTIGGGDLATLTEQVWRASQYLGGGVDVVRALLGTAVLATAAVVADWELTLVVGAAASLPWVLSRVFTHRSQLHQQRAAAASVAHTHHLVEAGRTAREHTLFGLWPQALERARTLGYTIRADSIRTRVYAGAAASVYSAGAVMLAVAAVTVAGGRQGSVERFAAASLLLLRAVMSAQQIQGARQALVDWAPAVDLVRGLDRRLPAGVAGATAPVGPIAELRLDAVVVELGGRRVLDGVDLTVAGPGLVGVVGPSGAGKSTLFDTVSGLVPVAAGRVLVDGVEVQPGSPADWYDQIGYAPQQAELLEGSLSENVSLSRRTADPVAVLEEVGLCGGAAGLSPETAMGPTGRSLSGGEAQRLGLARVLAAPGSLLLLDEPTAGLDPENRERITRIVMELARRRPVLVSTHRSELLRVCERVVVLDEGRVIDCGTLAEVERRSEAVASVLRGDDPEAGDPRL